MDISADFIEGIIMFADSHPGVDRTDISDAVWNLKDKGVDLSGLERDLVVAALEAELAEL